MLIRTLAFVALMAAASQIPRFIDFSAIPAAQTAGGGGSSVPSVSLAAATVPGAFDIPIDNKGHFSATFKINGKAVDGLVDTGATFVAMNESTARRLGFSGNGLDFKYAVNTANGLTEAARVTLDRIEIGTIRLKGVDAFVIRDKSLAGTLVGMSFLNRLESYKVENQTLKLKQ